MKKLLFSLGFYVANLLKSRLRVTLLAKALTEGALLSWV